MSILNQWENLPHNVKLNLARQYNIKWYGVSEDQLIHELTVKLPVNLFKVEVVVEVKETPETPETAEEVVEEVKEVKPKKAKTKKSK